MGDLERCPKCGGGQIDTYTDRPYRHQCCMSRCMHTWEDTKMSNWPSPGEASEAARKYNEQKAELTRLTAERDEAVASLAVMRKALDAAFPFVEQVESEESGEEAADALYVIRQIEAALATPSPRAERLLAVVEAAREFRECGTVLTSCDRGACQQVIERNDDTDPQAKLYLALRALDSPSGIHE